MITRLCHFHILSETIAKYLLALLGNFLNKVILFKNSQTKNVDVYDLINVEGSNRFQALNGVIYHNCLGIMYLMGPESLALKIQNDTGEPCSEDEAQEYIDLFDKIFHVFAKHRDKIFRDYKKNKMLVLPDGYIMWGDNQNQRSIKNCPIQGSGACIMRKAVGLAQDAGLFIPQTLHDALYIEGKTEDIGRQMDILAKAMDEAFEHFYPGREPALLEGSIWSPDFPDKETYLTTDGGLELKQQQIYIDGRSKEEYLQLSKYFKRDEILDLL